MRTDRYVVIILVLLLMVGGVLAFILLFRSDDGDSVDTSQPVSKMEFSFDTSNLHSKVSDFTVDDEILKNDLAELDIDELVYFYSDEENKAPLRTKKVLFELIEDDSNLQYKSNVNGVTKTGYRNLINGDVITIQIYLYPDEVVADKLELNKNRIYLSMLFSLGKLSNKYTVENSGDEKLTNFHQFKIKNEVPVSLTIN